MATASTRAARAAAGPIYLIFGAAGGIGRATCEHLARHATHGTKLLLVVSWTSQIRLKTLSEKYGANEDCSCALSFSLVPLQSLALVTFSCSRTRSNKASKRETLDPQQEHSLGSNVRNRTSPARIWIHWPPSYNPLALLRFVEAALSLAGDALNMMRLMCRMLTTMATQEQIS
jgi:NAD(P)-dependent dehydrogenase (short-subunit alcohol dehydrogenase family)